MSEADVIYNRPGLSALAYRMTTQDASLRRMLERLLSYALVDGPNRGAMPLQKLTTRISSDPALALLDAWAAVLDILTFYQERLANEHYLRTATEELSICELAKMLGYTPSPALAASTHLAFSIDTMAGNPEQVSVRAGTQVKSVPGQDEVPQTFETAEAITAQAAWNALVLLQKCPQILIASDVESDGIKINRLRFAGLGTGLRSGDLLRVCDRTVVRVDTLTPSALERVTDVEFTLLDGPAVRLRPPPELVAGDASALPLVLNADTIVQHILRRTWPDSELGAGLLERGFAAAELRQQLAALRLLAAVPQVVLAYRQTSGFFGVDAMSYASLYTSSTTTTPASGSSSGTTTTENPASWDETDGSELNRRTIWLDSSGRLYTGLGSYCSVYLDHVATGILPGSSLLLVRPGSVAAHTITAVVNTTVRGYGTSARATGLVLSGACATVDAAKASPWKTRDSTAYLQSETLELAATVPWPADLPVADALVLDTLVLGLAVGQPIFISGEVADAPGKLTSELAYVSNVVHRGGYTTIYLKETLAKALRASTISVCANVVLSTHGETVRDEILGSGDGSQKNQRFTLKRGPLGYLPAVAATGYVSTLQVRVNGVLWKEVDSLLTQDAQSPCYVVTRDASGATSVLFGDGTHGARLPSGQANVSATYRIGGGPAGEVGSEKLQLLIDRQLGLRLVKNPLAASGAVEAETADEIRENAPLSARTLGRAVSLSDYEAMAGAFPGIAKAQVIAAPVGGSSVVHLTVATEDGSPLPATSALYQSLLLALQKLGNPLQTVLLSDYQQRKFHIAARLVIDPRWLAATVLRSARTALKTAFAFGNRAFGQPVRASEVIAILQPLPGVVGLYLDALHYADAPAQRNAVLAAAAAQVAMDGSAVGAELLLLDLLDDALEIAP